MKRRAATEAIKAISKARVTRVKTTPTTATTTTTTTATTDIGSSSSSSSSTNLNFHTIVELTTNSLKALGSDEKLKRVLYFHRNKEEVKSFGATAPEIDGVFKDEVKPRLTDLNNEQRVNLAVLFSKPKVEEMTLVGIKILRSCKESDWDNLLNDRVFEFSNGFSSWATVDTFAEFVKDVMLEQFPQETIEFLRQWNLDRTNLWRRRASMVVFTRKIAKEGKFMDEFLEMCENLIKDEEYYVQMGVGWALKDALRCDKHRKRVLEYVKSLKERDISPVIVRYALRELKGKDKNFVLGV